MKFVIEGTIGKDGDKFKVEVNAKSAKHARELGYTKIGSTRGLRASQIEIIKVQESK